MKNQNVKVPYGFGSVTVGFTVISTAKLRMTNVEDKLINQLLSLKLKYNNNMYLTVSHHAEGNKVLIGYTTPVALYAQDMKSVIGDVLKAHALNRLNNKYAWTDRDSEPVVTQTNLQFA